MLALQGACDLIAYDGLKPGQQVGHWQVSAARVAIELPGDWLPGWYRLRLHLLSPQHLGVRKRCELFAGQSKLDTLEWNHELREDLLLPLAQRVPEVRLVLHHAQGELVIRRCELRPVSAVRTAARAIRLKLSLLTNYNCLWPVVRRGGRLLLEGNWSEFRRRILKGIGDSRTMRVEVKRVAEASAMWWRRRAASPEQLAAWREAIEALPHPEPIGLLMPVDPTRVDHAHQAILAVYRQVYPHWQLRVVWPHRRMDAKLRTAVRWDNRTQIHTPTQDRSIAAGWAEALAAACDSLPCESVILLPPDCELTEAALWRIAQGIGSRSPVGQSCELGCRGSGYPGVYAVTQLRERLPELKATTAVGVVKWAQAMGELPHDPHDPLLVPLDAGPATSVSVSLADRTAPLVLAADVRGISGWDHVAFAILKGLRSLGVPLVSHAAAQVLPELLPPRLQMPSVRRTRQQPQLAIAPPFLLGRFQPDARTAVLTMWETDHVESQYVAQLNRAAVVIVPSAWSAAAFRASGVTAPLEIVPLGYDPLVFSPHFDFSPDLDAEASVNPNGHPDQSGNRAGRRGMLSPVGLCVFGTAGALSAGGLRKNVRQVIRLFREAFPDEPDVRLRVKITPNCPPLDLPADDRIEVLRAALPYPELAAWNRSLTAYVNASAAEGFGFHLLEAMACGVPLISAEYSGLTAFFDGSVGYAVPHRVVPVGENAIYRGQWSEPDAAAIVARMREVYQDRAGAAARGRRAAARASRFTWRATGRQLAAVLQRYGLLTETHA